MSHFSSSSSVSFVDPLTYYSTSSHVTQFGYHPDHNTMKDSFDIKFFSSSLPSNQFLMHRNASIFSSSSTTSSSPPSSSYSSEYLDFNTSPIRRVCSTGDLQGMNGLQGSPKENQANETGTVPCKVGRYSAEKRKESVERYRTKRQQRNFQKKITYACRKTLADSRPRVKGRFARNGDNETEMEIESEITGTSYANFGYNNYSGNVYNQAHNNDYTSNSTRYWQEEINYEDAFWPNMVDMFSTNLLT